MAADPDTFFLHPHYTPHNLILVRAGRFDEGWAGAGLIRQWRDAAPQTLAEGLGCRTKPDLTCAFTCLPDIPWFGGQRIDKPPGRALRATPRQQLRGDSRPITKTNRYLRSIRT